MRKTQPLKRTEEMIKYALSALESIDRPGYEYKKAGVMVSGIVPDSQRQLGVYDQADRSRGTQLMLLIDELNTKMGRFTLRSAAMGDGSTGVTSQQYLSKRYTTQWDELLEVYDFWPGETKPRSRKQKTS